MAGLVRDAQIQPLTRETALTLVSSWRPRSVADGVRRIRAWVRRHMRLINEPVEILHGPGWMLDQIWNQGFVYGDCDDCAILSATIGLGLGLPSRFVAVRPPGAWEYIHVFTEFSDPSGNWYLCDPTSASGPPESFDRLELDI